jgi:aldose 1-epimerase
MLTLRTDDASLVLVPELGAGILGWTRGRIPLLRHAAPQAAVPGTVREMSCFPLVPYSNRIAHGRFTFGGTAHRLALNFGDHPNSIHGVGWQSPWRVMQITDDTATLSLPHTPDANWPFAFVAELQAHLTQAALRIELAITNQHNAPAPAGLGLHPFFPRGTTTLQFRADAVWQNGPDMIPTTRTAIPPDWDHAAPRAVGSAALDNCFEGWTGTATLAWPDRTLIIEASEIFRHLVVYTPPGQDFFCVEPVSHMNDAINRNAMHVLAQGETLRGTVTFRVS